VDWISSDSGEQGCGLDSGQYSLLLLFPSTAIPIP
jgi:hypothetical protein